MRVLFFDCFQVFTFLVFLGSLVFCRFIWIFHFWKSVKCFFLWFSEWFSRLWEAFHGYSSPVITPADSSPDSSLSIDSHLYKPRRWHLFIHSRPYLTWYRTEVVTWALFQALSTTCWRRAPKTRLLEAFRLEGKLWRTTWSLLKENLTPVARDLLLGINRWE